MQVSGQSWGQTTLRRRGTHAIVPALVRGSEWAGPSRVHRHQHDLGLGHLDALALPAAPPLGLDRDPDGDGGAAHPHRLGEEVDDVPEEDRLVELDLAHGLGDVAARGGLAGLDRRGEVDVGQDDAAEDGAEGVGVLGQQQDLDRGHALPGHGLGYRGPGR